MTSFKTPTIILNNPLSEFLQVLMRYLNMNISNWFFQIGLLDARSLVVWFLYDSGNNSNGPG